MTFRGYDCLFRQASARSAPALVLTALLVSACGTATIEDAVPQSAVLPAAADDPALAAGPIDTGTYPNLNVVPVAATEQLTPAERAAKTAELQAARQTVAADGASSSAGDPRLRQLAATHGEEVLKQIEGE